jgi:hypothetical protein
MCGGRWGKGDRVRRGIFFFYLFFNGQGMRGSGKACTTNFPLTGHAKVRSPLHCHFPSEVKTHGMSISPLVLLKNVYITQDCIPGVPHFKVTYTWQQSWYLTSLTVRFLTANARPFVSNVRLSSAILILCRSCTSCWVFVIAYKPTLCIVYI